ncbi:MAG: hypothetical protein ABI443_04680 [Chthoniobacterales bacterium]
MFRLTRKEQTIIAFLLLAFLLGIGVKHYRQCAKPQEFATQAITNNHD